VTSPYQPANASPVAFVTREDGSRMDLIPGEDDLTFCRRYFKGERFLCVGCLKVGKETWIEWRGACDACVKSLSPPEVNVDDRLVEAKVPPMMLGWTERGLIGGNEKARKTLMAWRGKGEQCILTIQGPNGSGKTGAAVCMLKRWLRSGTGLFVSCNDWLRELAWVEREGGSRGTWTDVVEFRGLVVLDEFAAKHTTPAGADSLFRCINHRQAWGLPTLCTTNRPLVPRAGRSEAEKGFSLTELSEQLAERVRRGVRIDWAAPKKG
jgi:hypothetical protein